MYQVKVAINNCADLDEIGPFGRAALHEAAARGHLEVVRLLVEQGASVHLQSKSGATALELARQKGHGAVAAYLEAVK
jgi:ankyrin repeat protein